RAFLELRCPVAGRIEAGGVGLEVRNALEPWNVLGEEPAAGGTSRFVDSSVERVEVRCEGLVPDRQEGLVTGDVLPRRAARRDGLARPGPPRPAWDARFAPASRRPSASGGSMSLLADYRPLPGTHDEVFGNDGEVRPPVAKAFATFGRKSSEEFGRSQALAEM